MLFWSQKIEKNPVILAVLITCLTDVCGATVCPSVLKEREKQAGQMRDLDIGYHTKTPTAANPLSQNSNTIPSTSPLTLDVKSIRLIRISGGNIQVTVEGNSLPLARLLHLQTHFNLDALLNHLLTIGFQQDPHTYLLIHGTVDQLYQGPDRVKIRLSQTQTQTRKRVNSNRIEYRYDSYDQFNLEIPDPR